MGALLSPPQFVWWRECGYSVLPPSPLRLSFLISSILSAAFQPLWPLLISRRSVFSRKTPELRRRPQHSLLAGPDSYVYLVPRCWESRARVHWTLPRLFNLLEVVRLVALPAKPPERELERWGVLMQNQPTCVPVERTGETSGGRGEAASKQELPHPPGAWQASEDGGGR